MQWDGGLIDADTYTGIVVGKNALGGMAVSVRIAPQSVQIPVPQETGFVFDGTEKTCLATEEEAPYIVAGENSAVEPGQYVVTVFLKDTGNYRWADDTVEPITYTWEITEEEETVAPPTAAEDDLSCTGEPQADTHSDGAESTAEEDGSPSIAEAEDLWLEETEFPEEPLPEPETKTEPEFIPEPEPEFIPEPEPEFIPEPEPEFIPEPAPEAAPIIVEEVFAEESPQAEE